MSAEHVVIATHYPVLDREHLPPGRAHVVRDGLGKTGVYRDPDGRLHAVSLHCTHLGAAWCRSTRRRPAGTARVTARASTARSSKARRPDRCPVAHPDEPPDRFSSSLIRSASVSWSSRMMMRHAASTAVPWSTSSLALAARRSW